MEKYKELLYLARQALECQLSGKEVDVASNVKEKYGEDGACFVTLTIEGELRGCIGSLESRQALYLDVIENAVNAGFHDHRFNVLEEDELDEVKIEISILTKPEKIRYESPEDLLRKLDDKMGILLKSGGSSSTFLPQVWEQIPDKTVFLEELSRKAGLDKDAWKDGEIWFYRVEKVSE